MLSATTVKTGMAKAGASALDGASTSAALSVVTSVSALRDLESKWRELESATQNRTSVFQSFDWVMAWAETYIGAKPGTTLHILAGYDGEELVFIWPLMRTRRLGISVLSWLTDPFGQYGDVLCRRGHCPKRWMVSSVAFLKRFKDVDILRLRHVRADSHLGSYAVELFSDARLPEKAPFLDLSTFDTEAAYDERYTSIQRKRRKKIRKAIERLGTVQFARLPVGVKADKAMQQAMDEKSKWLAERGRMNRVLGCPGHLTFLKNLSRRLGGTVEVVVTELTAGGKPVSWEVGFRHAGTHYGYITSHVTALTDLSPGRLHMDQSQRMALQDGIKTFDLMVPNDVHKESWSNNTVDTHDYYLQLSWRGAVLGHGYLRVIRPLIRSIYYRLDAATLRKLNVRTLFKKKSSPPEET